jgi:AraC-like DNA-binding protein
MKILALLPDDAREVLEGSLTGEQTLSRAGSSDSVAASLRERRCDALVLDPRMLNDGDFEQVLTALNKSGVPMLMYTTLGGPAAKRIVAAVDGAARELVLRGSDDMPDVLQRRIKALTAPTAPAMLLSKAASHFRAFPEKLQTVSVSLFGRSTLPRWVGGIVKESGLARRTVDRWMHAGGISGPGRLLDAARLARVWEPLVDRGISVEQVAQRYGYGQLRLLTAHSRRMTGVGPLELADHFTRAAFSKRLADALKE